jgi:hypothetical protein
MRNTLIILILMAVGCNQEEKAIADYYPSSQVSFNNRSYEVTEGYHSAPNDIAKEKIENSYKNWITQYIKDSLHRVDNWAGKLENLEGNDSVVVFGIKTNPQFIISGIVTARDPLYDTLIAMKEDSYVSFSGILLDPPKFTYNSYLVDTELMILLDSIKTISSIKEY